MLWSSYARGSDFYSLPQFQAVAGMIERDWWLYCETVAHSLLGWSDDDVARRLADVLRASTTAEAAFADVSGIREVDVTDVLPLVKARTLVLHRRQVPFMGANVVQPLASGIPGARLLLLEGSKAYPITDDMEDAVAPIEEFLSRD